MIAAFLAPLARKWLRKSKVDGREYEHVSCRRDRQSVVALEATTHMHLPHNDFIFNGE
jgi:hypothetical protein